MHTPPSSTLMIIIYNLDKNPTANIFTSIMKLYTGRELRNTLQIFSIKSRKLSFELWRDTYRRRDKTLDDRLHWAPASINCLINQNNGVLYTVLKRKYWVETLKRNEKQAIVSTRPTAGHFQGYILSSVITTLILDRKFALNYKTKRPSATAKRTKMHCQTEYRLILLSAWTNNIIKRIDSIKTQKRH